MLTQEGGNAPESAAQVGALIPGARSRDKSIWTAARGSIALSGGSVYVARWGIAALTVCFGILALLTTTTPDGTQGSTSRSIAVLVIAASTVPAAVLVTRLRVARSWWSVEPHAHRPTSGNNLFVAYADVGVTITLLLLRNPLTALLATVLFAIIGAYVAHFVRLRVVLGHVLTSSLIIVWLAAVANRQGVHEGTTVLLATASLISANGVVMLLRSYSSTFKQALAIQTDWANTDPLTGLMNRRSFTIAASEILRSQRPVTLIMIDVDRFKHINDEHGHAVGDAILRDLARRIADLAVPDAAIGRLGGDEFAVVMPVSADQARALIAQIHLTPEIHNGIPVTVSVGAAAYHGFSSSPVSLVDAISAADNALLTAKQAGRNNHVMVVASETRGRYDHSIRPTERIRSGTTTFRNRARSTSRRPIDSSTPAEADMESAS
ncbi:GGDEF domain-containing protein [Gordonia polyisoprenivorans]|uniref:GGDEF domain-containing protein n=1 Tax=Gordonia polyisoprenivorans TaxID=84595 RepID=UPI001AD649B8|nr:GGDEF domain-containing protein [Gordonia polyisoprenivorans]QTI69069.1 GGDEF domain-containing protein [Gordonia polyisoprenivorans]